MVSIILAVFLYIYSHSLSAHRKSLYVSVIYYCIPRSPRACNAVVLLNCEGEYLQRYITCSVQHKRPFDGNPNELTIVQQRVRQRNTDGVDICPAPANKPS